MSPHPLFDTAVIGGGPAGLVCAMNLARLRRRVILFDAGVSRAASIPRSHNYPGFPEGLAGAALIERLWRQLSAYPVVTRSARVDGLGTDPEGFRLVTQDGEVAARTVVLATGASDVPPRMAHLEQALARGALRYCPVCDGYEVVGQAVGVLSDGPSGAHEALYLKQFTDRLIVFTDGGAGRLGVDLRAELDANAIELNDAPVLAVEVDADGVRVRHESGETHCDSMYCALGMQVHSGLAVALGAAADESGYLEIDAHHRTGVPGLYAIGDVAQGLNQITVAYGGASIAASAIHVALNQSPQVTSTRRDVAERQEEAGQ